MSEPLRIVRSASEDLFPGAARFRLIGLDDLAKLPEPVCLVENLVPDPALTFLLGAPGAGKSLLALDLALSVAMFRGSWFGRKLHGGPVVYVLGEGLASLRRRVGAWAWANPDAGNGPIAFCDRLPDLCDTGSVLDFVEAIVSRPVEMPALIVLDTFSRAIPGADENSAQDMSRAVASLDFIRSELNTSILCVHHTGKDRTRGARGSSVLSAAADAELQLECVDGVRELKPTKMRDGTLDQRLTFRLVPALGSAHLALVELAHVGKSGDWRVKDRRTLTRADRRALSALDEFREVSWTRWVAVSGLAQSTLIDVRRRLLDLNYVQAIAGERNRFGKVALRYIATGEGIAALITPPNTETPDEAPARHRTVSQLPDTETPAPPLGGPGVSGVVEGPSKAPDNGPADGKESEANMRVALAEGA